MVVERHVTAAQMLLENRFKTSIEKIPRIAVVWVDKSRRHEEVLSAQQLNKSVYEHQPITPLQNPVSTLQAIDKKRLMNSRVVTSFERDVGALLLRSPVKALIVPGARYQCQ